MRKLLFLPLLLCAGVAPIWAQCGSTVINRYGLFDCIGTPSPANASNVPLSSSLTTVTVTGTWGATQPLTWTCLNASTGATITPTTLTTQIANSATFTFASTPNAQCNVNATGGAGPIGNTGPVGPAGPIGPAGLSGPANQYTAFTSSGSSNTVSIPGLGTQAILLFLYDTVGNWIPAANTFNVSPTPPYNITLTFTSPTSGWYVINQAGGGFIAPCIITAGVITGCAGLSTTGDVNVGGNANIQGSLNFGLGTSGVGWSMQYADPSGNLATLQSAATNTPGAVITLPAVTGNLLGTGNTTGHNVSAPLICAAASGSGTAYTCSSTPTFVPADGDVILFQADLANTGAATLVVNGQSGTPGIKKQGGGTALIANDLLAGQDTLLEFDGVNWQMQGQTGNAAAGGSVTSVGFTGGIVSVATQTTTPAFTVAGTSGGVVCFTSASAWATSGALTANNIMLGGGAGVCPTVTVTDTTTTHALFATAGAPAFRALASTDMPAQVTLLNGANTGGAAFTLDMHAATGGAAFRLPVGAGFTSSAAGVTNYDSTAGNTHIYTNSADSLAVAEAAALAANAIPKATDATHGLLAASSITDNGTKVSTTEFLQSTKSTQQLTADSSGIVATTAATGTVVFTWGALPVSTNLTFQCRGTYTQATAAGGVSIAVQGATNAPTSLNAWATLDSTNPASTTYTGTKAGLYNLTSTTATLVAAVTPGAIATQYQWELNGEVQSGASATTLNIIFFSGSASDSVVVKAGSFCVLQ